MRESVIDLDLIAQWLRENLSNPPLLEELGDELGVSQYAIRKAFETQWKITPGVWLREQRMAEAARRLRESDEEIQSIANAVGYTSSSRFAEAFRRTYRCRPGEYRLEHRSEAGCLESELRRISPSKDGQASVSR